MVKEIVRSFCFVDDAVDLIKIMSSNLKNDI